MEIILHLWKQITQFEPTTSGLYWFSSSPQPIIPLAVLRRSCWMDMTDQALVMVKTKGIAASLTNDEKRAHLKDLNRERLLDLIRETRPPERSLDVEADLEYLDRIEVEFRVEAAPDGGGLAEAVLLTRKQQIPNWCALPA
jgi:hypothetical protein